MTERERKMMAFIVEMLLKMCWNNPVVSANEIQQLDNIANELGFDDLDENEFRY